MLQHVKGQLTVCEMLTNAMAAIVMALAKIQKKCATMFFLIEERKYDKIEEQKPLCFCVFL